MKIKPFCWILFYPCVLLSCNNNRSSTKKVFRYNEATNIATLDPAFAKNQSIIWAVHQLYNTLVETDSALQIVPSLARSWTVSADRLVYRFQLRTDVVFHDDVAFAGGKGRKMTARDVVYSFQRIIDPATASSGAWIFNNRIDPLHPFVAVNDSVFELRLARPFAPVLGLLSMTYCSVVPKEVVSRHGKDFGRHPSGTGPFKFRFWEEGQALVFLKNENYFQRDSSGQRLPYVDAVKVSFYNNKATEFLLFRQGKLDFINDIDASFKDEILTKKGVLKKEWQGKIQLQKYPYLNTEYLGILYDSTLPAVKASPLKHKLIRQAINYGFDRKKLMMYLRNSVGIAAESGFIPAGLPAYDPLRVRGYSYNPRKARQLLAEAGYPGGKGLPRIKLLTVPTYAELAGFIARELMNIGLVVEVDVVQKSLLLEQTANSTALFFRASWIADYPDAENYLSVFYSKNPAPPNYTHYANKKFDLLYEQALLITDDSIRSRRYQEMDQMVMEDAPVVPLWYDQLLHLVQPGVTGFTPNGLNLLELRTVRVP